MVYAGESEGLYWIDNKGSADDETSIMEFVSHGLEQGKIDLFDFEEQRISVIKVGSSYFCRKVPFTTVPLDEGASK